MQKFNVNKVAAGVGLVAVVVGQGQALAETVPASASVSVQNTFTLTQVQPLAFGTIRAVAQADGANSATVVISPVPSTAPAAASLGTASAQVITAGTPGQFSVAGAAPFANLNINFPATQTNLTAPASPPGTPKFFIAATTGWDAYITSGPNANTAYNDSAPNLQTSATGDVNFNLGATLSTDNVATTLPYADATYNGNFNLVVVY